jgi:hypothetical protein
MTTKGSASEPVGGRSDLIAELRKCSAEPDDVFARAAKAIEILLDVNAIFKADAALESAPSDVCLHSALGNCVPQEAASAESMASHIDWADAKRVVAALTYIHDTYSSFWLQLDELVCEYEAAERERERAIAPESGEIEVLRAMKVRLDEAIDNAEAGACDILGPGDLREIRDGCDLSIGGAFKGDA